MIISLKDLYNKRIAVGKRIDCYIKDHGFTKGGLCKKSGLSRPTLDRIIRGEISNQAYFDKHLEKILSALNITPNELMGGPPSTENHIAYYRELLRLDSGYICDVTGIPEERLREIELGEEPSLAELRDLAVIFFVSVADLLTERVFESPLAVFDYGFFGDETENVSGFWGHIGVIPYGGKKVFWYPISYNCYHRWYDLYDKDYVIVPCLNNRILLLNMSNIREVVLVDDACDTPNLENWIDDKEIEYIGEYDPYPGVVYESLQEYLYEDEDLDDEEKMSDRFKKYMAAVVEKEKWDEGDIWRITSGCKIIYKDGQSTSLGLSEEESRDLGAYIEFVGDFDSDFMDKNIKIEDYDGVEHWINIEKVSMMEMPLILIENAIIENRREEYGDMERG